MTRLLPKSLFGQTVLILLAGLLVSHLVGGWIYTKDREQAVRAVGGLAIAQRIVNVAHLVGDAPMDWRDRIVADASDPTFRVTIAGAAPSVAGNAEQGPVAQAIRDFIVGQVSDGSAGEIRVAVSGASVPSLGTMLNRPMPMAAMMNAAGSWRGLQVAIQLMPDRQWLSISTTLPDAGPALSWQFLLSMSAMAVVVVVVSIWAVRRVTVPLRALAIAAERLGKDIKSPPVAVLGTVEMRAAARAFNEMQDRLRRLIENRTRMLAAISHDLRTPLTLLRLRAESVESDEGEKMLGTIATMNAMIDAALAFARDEAAVEPRRPVDIAALIASVVDDMADAGFAVTMAPAEQLIYDCQPVSLKRAITNLLDNAIKYGKRAHASLKASADAIEIVIDDEGPGIPENEIARVLQPFYRLDPARGAETGGIGLGLAIAQAIAEAQGGSLTLSNRQEGGLRVVIRLPR